MARKVSTPKRKSTFGSSPMRPVNTDFDLMQDDSELFMQLSDNESFRPWLTDTAFGLTYVDGVA